MDHDFTGMRKYLYGVTVRHDGRTFVTQIARDREGGAMQPLGADGTNVPVTSFIWRVTAEGYPPYRGRKARPGDATAAFVDELVASAWSAMKRGTSGAA